MATNEPYRVLPVDHSACGFDYELGKEHLDRRRNALSTPDSVPISVEVEEIEERKLPLTQKELKKHREEYFKKGPRPSMPINDPLLLRRRQEMMNSQRSMSMPTDSMALENQESFDSDETVISRIGRHSHSHTEQMHARKLDSRQQSFTKKEPLFMVDLENGEQIIARKRASSVSKQADLLTDEERRIHAFLKEPIHPLASPKSPSKWDSVKRGMGRVYTKEALVIDSTISKFRFDNGIGSRLHRQNSFRSGAGSVVSLSKTYRSDSPHHSILLPPLYKLKPLPLTRRDFSYHPKKELRQMTEEEMREEYKSLRSCRYLRPKASKFQIREESGSFSSNY